MGIATTHTESIVFKKLGVNLKMSNYQKLKKHELVEMLNEIELAKIEDKKLIEDLEEENNNLKDFAGKIECYSNLCISEFRNSEEYKEFEIEDKELEDKELEVEEMNNHNLAENKILFMIRKYLEYKGIIENERNRK